MKTLTKTRYSNCYDMGTGKFYAKGAYYKGSDVVILTVWYSQPIVSISTVTGDFQRLLKSLGLKGFSLDNSSYSDNFI